jgi:catechol 2,3-dioxygenase-like lactoylglutathione lyase family enzyme
MTFLLMMPNLYVSDVERAAAFYRDLLGGTETFRLPAEGPAVQRGTTGRRRHDWIAVVSKTTA